MLKNVLSLSGFALSLACVGAAQAGNWNERDTGGQNNAMTTDAGQSLATANITAGMGALTRIQGQMVHTRDADLFQITINDPMSFSANVRTLQGPTDTNLFIFDSTGVAICMNDNDPTGVGGTRSRLDGSNIPSAGTYYLAISRNDRGFGAPKLVYPLAAGGVMIFPENNFNMQNQPLVAGTVLDSFRDFATGFGDIFNTRYRIDLTGAGYGAVPAPGAAALLGLGGLLAVRRRR